MKLFAKASDGGATSGVTGYFLIEAKPVGSIVLLHFNEGSREAYHSHAFNAVTFWLRGQVKEHHLSGETKLFSAGQVKYTSRSTFHKVEGIRSAWAISFRGPWVDQWWERRGGRFVTLTHGRKVVS